MAFCSKCGAQLNEGEKNCPSCGAPIDAETQETKTTDQSIQTDSSQKIGNLNNTTDTTADYDAQDIQNNKAMAILAYLSWLVLIPLLAAKDSKFSRYHCNQGIILAIAELIAGIGCGILSLIPYIGLMFSVIGTILEFGCFILAVAGIINVANGRAKELPVVGKFKILK